MLSVASKIPKKVKKGGSLQPILPLLPEKLPTKEDGKGAFLTFDLKMQFDQAENATKYKKKTFASLKKGRRSNGSISSKT